MKALSVMVIAGEASGDAHAAALVEALRPRLVDWLRSRELAHDRRAIGLEPRFFGAGGPRMAEAGVDLVMDLTSHAVVGLVEVMRHLITFRRLFRRLVELARVEQPDVIILVDFAGFNRRFAAEIQRHVRSRRGPFGNWAPKIVYFISPQVWASRPGRARQLERDVDLMLSIFPFERAWYARRVPRLPVEFVGHPMVDRFARMSRDDRNADESEGAPQRRVLAVLPGSRAQEVRRHLPVMVDAVRLLQREVPVEAWMSLPNQELADLAMSVAPVRFLAEGEKPWRSVGDPAVVYGRIGGMETLLARADLAITKSGSVALECAFFRLPTVVMYRVLWPTWWVASCIVQVPFAAMPNLLAGRAIFPELLQGDATAERIAREASQLMDPGRRAGIRADLDRVVESLGEPGAMDRAAVAVVRLVAGEGSEVRGVPDGA